MKKKLSFIWLPFLILTGNYCYSQYAISGYLDTPEKNKKVYLSLLRYDEQSAISKNQVLTSTLTDSTGYFSFTGTLLSKQHKLYRIHANLDEASPGFDIADVDERKNFHNFIFSNTDTIVFEKSKDFWFSISENTNPIDREWREVNSYKNKLGKEFSGIKNREARAQSLEQLLSEFKVNLIKTQRHPLVKLILLTDFHEDILKQDFENDPEFYLGLKSELNKYFSNTSYALQFEDLITDLSISQVQEQLVFYKKMTYLLSIVAFVLTLGIFFLWMQVRKAKRGLRSETINLTKQEEKIANLILQEKTNKEIAAELFISLSTVKTHIRNLYAKLEVSNRQQLADKIKKSS